MIPTFDDYGLLPTGEHPCTLSDVYDHLCWNHHRAHLYSKLCSFLSAEWENRQETPIYIDGSFVRKKDLPEDIDVVIDVSNEQDQLIVGKALYLWTEQPRIKQQYSVDLWIRHPRIPNDLVEFFQYVGTKASAELSIPHNHPKGILRISP